MIRSTMIVGLLGSLCAPAMAEETIVKEHDRPAPGVVIKAPVPGVVVKDRDHDCSSTTVHSQNDEGDSKTVKKTNCD